MTSAGQWGPVLPSCADDDGAQSGGIAKSAVSAMHDVRSVPRPRASSRAPGNLTPQYIISKEEQRCWGELTYRAGKSDRSWRARATTGRHTPDGIHVCLRTAARASRLRPRNRRYRSGTSRGLSTRAEGPPQISSPWSLSLSGKARPGGERAEGPRRISRARRRAHAYCRPLLRLGLPLRRAGCLVLRRM